MSEPKVTRPHMPGYGVPKDLDGARPWSWGEERFAASKNYYVATSRPDGRPHLMPVWAVWLDGRLYFSTGFEARKAKNLAANPACVIATEGADEAVILEGMAARTHDREVIKAASKLYKAKYGEPMSEAIGGIWEVRPSKAFAFVSSADEFSAAATRWVWE